VYVEDSPVAADLAGRAAALAGQGRWADAAAVYQSLVEEYAGKLMPRPDASGPAWVDVTRWVRQQVTADAALREAYRRDVEPAAARARQQAKLGEDAGGFLAWDERALAAVMERYWPTRSGLWAGLDVAALALERGDAADALALLDDLADHPDLTGTRDGDAAALARRDALRAAAEPLAARLHAARRIDTAPPAVHRGQAPTLEDPMWWRRIGEEDAGDGEAAVARAALAERFPGVSAVPTVAGERVLVNDGDAVSAIDRASGRLVWTHRPSDDPAGVDERQALRRMMRYLPDRRGVLIVGDAVVAVTGRAASLPGRFADAAPGTALVCLDLRTGEVRWEADPFADEPALQRAHLLGTPVALGRGLAAVAVRRTQATGFVDCLVIAVRLSDGQLVWRRHVSSTAVGVGGGPHHTVGGAGLTLYRGGLLVSDGLGVAAAIGPRTGSVRWLRQLVENPAGDGADAFGGIRTVTQDHWDGPVAPVPLEAGVVVAVNEPKGPAAAVLDPDTGDVRLRLTTDDLGDATDLRGVEGDLLVVGRRTQRRAGDTLATRWSARIDRLAADVVGAAPVELPANVRPGLRIQQRAGQPNAGPTVPGAVGIGAGYLVLPVRGGMVTLSWADGTLWGGAGWAPGRT
jgi:hypothetical protein